MIGEMIGAIEISKIDSLRIEVNPADGTVVHHKPGFHSLGGFSPGSIQYGEHQMDEETSMAEDDDTVLGLSLPVPMTGEELG